MEQRDAANKSNKSFVTVRDYESCGTERHIARLIYGIVLFAFFYFGMGAIIFVFFR